jgi:hypothetical protein
VQRFKERLSSDDLRLSERYFKGEIHVLVHLRPGNDTKYVASFQREWNTLGRSEKCTCQLGVAVMPDHAQESVPETTNHTCRHTLTEIRRRSGNQELMLVNNIQTVEMPENLSAPSTVWLDTINRSYSLWPCSLYSGFRGFEFLGIGSDGKVHMGKWTGRSLGDNHQGMSQMVKSASDVVNGITRDERDVFVDGRNINDFVDSISGLRIVLNSDSILLAVLPSIPQLLKVENVLVGPF